MSERQTEIIQRAADLMIGALNEYRQDAPTAEKVCAQMNALHAAGLTITPQAGEAVPVADEHDDNPRVGQCCNYASRQAYGDCEYCGRKRTAPPRPACDSNHAAPSCADPECWQRPSPVAPAKTLDQWHEDFGPVVWFCWDSENKRWLGEPAWIGTPNDDSWPDYHTHWIPHPDMPAPPDSPGHTEEA